ncbi:MOSC domain-containing protein [Corallincola platygyrae]|uniref:MOSC domain-containing protein n=1 Tax=Corallincola platygyrae TaxID=1193278 RepID=A0ABW4XPX7_9GAMM
MAEAIITQLNIYPVKSLGAISLNQSTLTTQGLAFDRQWMLVDAKGRFVTQRQCPALAKIKPKLTDSELVLCCEGEQPLSISLSALPQSKRMVQVWSDTAKALDEGELVAQWLSQALKEDWPRPIYLVRFDPKRQRPVSEKHLNAHESADTFFADGYPFLVTNEATLTWLNQKLEEKNLPEVTMDRFRPNIVVKGPAPLSENSIRELSHNKYVLGLRKPCQRCPMITVDQTEGVRQQPAGEPLRTLSELNTLGEEKPGAYFGQNAILLIGKSEQIAVGDRLEL